MTQRSVQTTHNPTVIIRSGGDVRVEGQESDHVLAHAEGHWGLKLERRGETIEVSLGLNGEVQVPLESSVKVYSGKSAEVRNVRGSVAIYAGWKVLARGVRILVHAASGGSMDFECDTVEGKDVKFSAGGSLRCHIRLMADARISVHDSGGYWEGRVGSGQIKIRLHSGGEATLVTDQEIVAQPPHYVLGNIVKP